MTTTVGRAQIIIDANTNAFVVEVRRARDTTRQAAGDMSRNLADAARNSRAATSEMNRGLNAVAQSARDLKSALAGMVIGGGIVAGLDRLKSVSDEMRNLDTQVRLATASEKEFLAVRERLRGIADYTHNDIKATTELYQNSARALANMGRSQEDVLKFTKNVSLAMATGGKSAQEQAAAIMQLGQAMQSGVVQGDEFRSISENAPIILDLVAEKLGKTRGEVRALSKEGKITAEVMLNSLLDSTEKLEAMYAKVPATIAGAWQVIKNRSAEAVGDFLNQQGGISDAIAQQLLKVADALTATVGFVEKNAELIKNAIVTAVGVAAVAAFGKLSASAIATVPSLAASAKAMAVNAVAAAQNATSNARLASTLLAIVQGHTPAQMAIYRYTQALIGATTTSVAFVRNLPATIAGLQAQAAAALTSARSINVLAVAQNAAASGAVLMARGALGVGTGLKALAGIINRHPILALASVLATVVIGTEGLEGAMKSLGEAVGVTGILFQRFAAGAVEGIRLLANSAVRFFNDFRGDSEGSAKTASQMFTDMFGKTERGFLGIMQVSATVFDKIGSHVRASAIYATIQMSNAMTAIHNGFVHMGNGIKSVFESVANFAVGAMNLILAGVNKVIDGANSIKSRFGSDETYQHVDLIGKANFGRSPLLSYDPTRYGQVFRDTETSALRNGVDSGIAQQRAQTAASQQATAALGDLSRAAKGASQSMGGKDDKNNKKEKKGKKDAQAIGDYQLAVYQAWKKAGLSDQQAKIMTAEVGRENAYNPNILFGYHTDAANKAKNVGMLSWQKNRATNLEEFLKNEGLLKGGKIERSQASLDAMARFAVNEILTNPSYARTKNQFLANPNIDTQTGFAITGDNFIRWDRSGKAVLGAAGAAKHAARRDAYYRQISAKAGLVDGKESVKDLQRDANQAMRDAERQAEARLRLERETADKLTQLRIDRDKKIQEVMDAGFDPTNQKEMLDKVEAQYQADVRAYAIAQKQKVAAYSDFRKTERQLAQQKFEDDEYSILADKDLLQEAKDAAIANITLQREWTFANIDLTLDKERQAANAAHQTRVENIIAEAQLARRENDLNLKIDEETRRERREAIDRVEKESLELARTDFEEEVNAATNYALTELERLNREYDKLQRDTERRTDINAPDKLRLSEAQRAKYEYDKRELQKQAAANFNALNAEMSGTADLYNLQTQLDARLEIVQKALDAQTIQTEQAAHARLAIERNYWMSMQQLYMAQSAGIAQTVADMGKIMLGETSGAYKRLFAVSQSFVMAQAGLNMYKAISDGWAQGATLPQKITAAATAGTEMLKIITAAQQVKLQGFMVGGFTGTGRDTDVAGLVHANEYVFDADATRRIGTKNLESIRKGDGIGGNTTVNVNVTVNSNGTSSVESDKQLGKNIGDAVNAAVQKALLKERRQGGMLGVR